jgi:hypothetical protein
LNVVDSRKENPFTVNDSKLHREVCLTLNKSRTKERTYKQHRMMVN